MKSYACGAAAIRPCEMLVDMNPKVRVRKPPAELPDVPSGQIIMVPPAEDLVVDPRTWFPSRAPLELEIGSGKGGFLLERARTHPEISFLGIEWANKFFLFAADRMARWNVANVRLMRTDAKQFVLRNLAPGCLSALHLYHPDPWPKKRHHKRRLVQPDFVDAAARSLQDGARWYIQSDHEEYFHEMAALLDSHAQFNGLDAHAVDEAFGPTWAGTNFENKYRAEGRAIYRAVYQRR